MEDSDVLLSTCAAKVIGGVSRLLGGEETVGLLKLLIT